ncbi:MAG: hypothetical protein FD134_782 [Gallionellaceae bacterium]|nr:MAG: hypothetical protein FD134_782 [Gallionellaceae bacterium]
MGGLETPQKFLVSRNAMRRYAVALRPFREKAMAIDPARY